MLVKKINLLAVVHNIDTNIIELFEKKHHMFNFQLPAQRLCFATEEYKLANGCAPWTSSNASACPEIPLAECFAERMAGRISWLLVSWQVGSTTLRSHITMLYTFSS